MTDRYRTLTVILEGDTRDDACAPLIAAIAHMRGVLKVTGGDVETSADMVAMERARYELRDKIWQALYPKRTP